jgi:hypothetical protein
MPEATDAADTTPTIPQPKKKGSKKKSAAQVASEAPTADPGLPPAGTPEEMEIEVLKARVAELEGQVADLQAQLQRPTSPPPPSAPPDDEDETVVVHNDERSVLGFLLPRKKGSAPKLRVAFDVDLEASDIDGLLGKGDKLNRSRAGLIVRGAVNALKAAISKGLSVRIEGGI